MKYKIIGPDIRKIDEDSFADYAEYSIFLDYYFDFIDKEIAKRTGYGPRVLHLFNSAFFNEHYILTDENIAQCYDYLAIKDGANLVEYENGTVGLMADYSGHENGFEILTLIDAFNLAGIKYSASENAIEYMISVLNASCH